MAERKTYKPTDTELEILAVLWDQGPCTVRDVYKILNRRKPTGYTTVLKLLQIMTEKHLVKRDESERAHVYTASAPREKTQRQLLGDLLERAFQGSASSLVMNLLSSKKASPSELAEIRELLDRLEDDAR
jgi:predicted transcriptional regulator